MYKIEVGQPYPGVTPQQEGTVLELGPDGDLVLMVRMDQPSANEATALKAGFERYSLFEIFGSPSLAAFVFKFPAPVGYVEAPFHAGLYPDGRASKYLEIKGDMLQVYVLDGNIVTVARIVGLQHDSAARLREIIRRQLTEDVTMASYNAAVDRLYRMTSEQIYRAGHQYRHGGRA